MSKNYLITPEGTKDYLFDELRIRKKIEYKLRDTFEFRGYNQVVTPCLEFLDVFNMSEKGMPIEKMYKMIDSKGRLMALRTDTTMPIARLCATRLKNEKMPLRLYYNQNVYSINQSLKGRSDEVLQSGIELIGDSTDKADIEVLVTAIKCLQNLDIDNFRLEIGHIGIFNNLVKLLNISKEEKENIRQLIENKNYPALNDILDQVEEKEVANIIKMLPRLFGEKEIFDKAKLLMQNNSDLIKILDYLEKLYSILGELNLSKKIIVDLGIVNRAEYYTGIVFKGYIEGFGEEVLSGGRYDNLLKDFGRDLTAIGFAVNIDAIFNAVVKVKNISKTIPQVMVFAEKGYEIKALEHLDKLAQLKIIAEYSLKDSLEETMNFAKEKGIGRIDIVNENINTIEI